MLFKKICQHFLFLFVNLHSDTFKLEILVGDKSTNKNCYKHLWQTKHSQPFISSFTQLC